MSEMNSKNSIFWATSLSCEVPKAKLLNDLQLIVTRIFTDVELLVFFLILEGARWMMFMAGVLIWDHGKKEAKMVVSPSASAFHKSIGKQFSQFELSNICILYYMATFLGAKQTYQLR